MTTEATYDGRQMAPWLMLVPALCLYVVILFAPLVNLFIQSFFRFEALVGIIHDPTFDNYTKFFTDAFFLGVLARTLKMAVIVVVLCLVIGWPVAYQLSRLRGQARIYLMLVILAPLLISVVVRTFGWVVVLGPNGLVNEFLQGLGVIDEPLRLLFTEGAVIVGMVHVMLPFMILSISAALDNIDPLLLRAAENLGAKPNHRLTRVLLPLSLPGVLAGTVIVFGLSTSAFVTPAILGGSGIKYMSSLIFQYNMLILNWPFGGALSFVLLGLTFSIVMAYTRVIERGRYRGVFER